MNGGDRMRSKTSVIWIRIVLIGFALLGISLALIIFTDDARTSLCAFKPIPPNKHNYDLWAGFLCASLVPCYAVLVLGWLITNHIERDNTFSKENSKLLKAVGIISAVDSAFFLCGTVYFFNLGLSGFVFLISLIAVFIGITFSIAAFVLSRMTARDAVLQDENDLTI